MTVSAQEVMVTKVDKVSVSVTLAAETEAAIAAKMATVENCIVERETEVKMNWVEKKEITREKTALFIWFHEEADVLQQ